GGDLGGREGEGGGVALARGGPEVVEAPGLAGGPAGSDARAAHARTLARHGERRNRLTADFVANGGRCAIPSGGPATARPPCRPPVSSRSPGRHRGPPGRRSATPRPAACPRPA